MKFRLIIVVFLFYSFSCFGQEVQDSMESESIESIIDTFNGVTKYTVTETYKSGKIITIVNPTISIDQKLAEQKKELRELNADIKMASREVIEFRKELNKWKRRKSELLAKRLLLRNNWVKPGKAPVD